MSDPALTPIPETPDESRNHRDGPVATPSGDPLIAASPNSNPPSPFAPASLSEPDLASDNESEEASDALTGAAVSLAAARARLRQASIANPGSSDISAILDDLEILNKKLHIFMASVPDTSQSPETEPSLAPARTPAASVGTLRQMRGLLEIGQDFDEATASAEISDLRRVRRQLRYLFALDSRKSEVAISDPVVAATVSARRLSSRDWAENFVKNF
jgi:hypothetical protein